MEFPPDRVSGKRVRRYVRGPSETKVNAKVRALLEARGRGGPTPHVAGRTSITVSEWLTQWADAGAAGVAAKTLNRYRGLIRYQILPVLGHMRLADLRADHVRAAWERLAAQSVRSTTGEPVAGTTLSDSTLRQAQAVLRKAVADAVHDDVIPRDYLRGRLRAPQVRAQKPGKALTLDEARSLLGAAAKSESPARWLLALTTGLRQAETLGLSWSAIHWDQKRIDVGAQLHYEPWRHGCSEAARCGWYRIDCHSPSPCPGGPDCPHAWHRARNRPCPMTRAHPTCPLGGPCSYTARLCPIADGGPRIVLRTKSNRDRIVLLTPTTMDALSSHKRRQDFARRRAGESWESRPDFDGLVFTGANGQPVNPREDHAQWKRLLADASVAEARLHDARHTSATILTALGVDSAVIQTLLGHSSVATTRGYQDVTAEILRPAIDALHAALSDSTRETVAPVRRRTPVRPSRRR